MFPIPGAHIADCPAFVTPLSWKFARRIIETRPKVMKTARYVVQNLLRICEMLKLGADCQTDQILIRGN
jgi:hypothetical protein